MAGLMQHAVAVPILPGKEEAWCRFLQELGGSRREAFAAARARLGIRRELIWRAQAGGIDLAIVVVTAVAQPAALVLAEVGTSPFDRWYAERWQEIHGIDPTRQRAPRPGPPLFDWRAR